MTNTMFDKRKYFMMGNALVTGIIKKNTSQKLVFLNHDYFFKL